MENPLVFKRIVRCNPTDPDPAISEATPVENLGNYVRTRDESLLTFTEGCEPERFSISRLPAPFVTDVLDGVFPIASRRLTAFRAACHLVERSQANGGEIKAHAAGTQAGKGAYVCQGAAHGTEMAPLPFVQEIADHYGAEVIQEMGQVAIDLARLPRKAQGPFSSWGGSAAGR